MYDNYRTASQQLASTHIFTLGADPDYTSRSTTADSAYDTNENGLNFYAVRLGDLAEELQNMKAVDMSRF